MTPCSACWPAPAELEKMQKALREMAIGDANERIYETLCALVKQK